MRIVTSLIWVCLITVTAVNIFSPSLDSTFVAQEQSVEEINEILDEEAIPSSTICFVIPDLVFFPAFFKDYSGINPTRRVLKRPPKFLA